MNALFYPHWLKALNSSGLPANVINSHRIAMNWYLSYLSKRQELVTVQTAREFIEFARETKNAEEWMVERWKGGFLPMRPPESRSIRRRDA